MNFNEYEKSFTSKEEKLKVVEAHNKHVNKIYASSIFHNLNQVDFTTLSNKQYEAYRELKSKATKYLQSFEE